MARKRSVSRRTALKVTGATAATALVAGCGGGGGGDDDDGGDDGGDDGIEVSPGEIELSANTSGWVGVAPSDIEEEENPTLILEADSEYEMFWSENQDDADHNLEIRDDNDEVIDDLETPEVADPGDDQRLTFTANSDMVEYVCDPHENSMVGDLVVE